MTHTQELTRNQALVFGVLSGKPGPVTAYALLHDLRDDGLRNPNQVYRALDKLMEYGLVHRLESLNAFVACAHRHDHAHAHAHGMIAFAICEACGQAEEFSDAAIEERLKGWSNDHAFHLSRAIIEMRGTCESCAGTQAKIGPSA